MSETLSAERYPIEIIQGVEGFCIGLNNYRIAGPKPWGGGTVVKRWHVSLADLGKAIPAVATIEALQAELQEQRRVVNAARRIIANADGHPAMCCGKCSSAIAKAEVEVTTLRTALERIAQSAKALRYASIEDKALEALHGRE